MSAEPILLTPLVGCVKVFSAFPLAIGYFYHRHNRRPPSAVRFQNKRTPFRMSFRFGAARQIRTADLILTKRPQNFFLTIFVALWPYPLQTACFPSLFENMVSTCSAALCGKLCGQTVVAVGLAIWRFAQMWSECGFLRRRSNAPAWFWQVTTELLLRWC